MLLQNTCCLSMDELQYDSPQAIVNGIGDYFGSVYINSSGPNLSAVDLGNMSVLHIAEFTENEILTLLIN